MTVTPADIRDVNFCLQKAGEYRAKAKATDRQNLQCAFEAAAREYDSRAKENAGRTAKSNAVEEGRPARRAVASVRP
jgi:hypothetical protein